MSAERHDAFDVPEWVRALLRPVPEAERAVQTHMMEPVAKVVSAEPNTATELAIARACIEEAEDVLERHGRPEGERLSRGIEALAAESTRLRTALVRIRDSGPQGSAWCIAIAQEALQPLEAAPEPTGHTR